MKIQTSDALKMITAYKMQRYDVINSVVNNTIAIPENDSNNSGNFQNYTPNGNEEFIDSRAITFSLESIEKFIRHIKNKMKENHIDPSVQFSGLRFYYIVYDPKIKFVESIEKNYRNLHSMVLVPTYFNKATGEETDFDPEFNDGAYDGDNSFNQLLSLKNITTEVAPTINAMQINLDSSLNLQNRGSLVPPPRTGGGCDLMESADRIYPNGY